MSVRHFVCWPANRACLSTVRPNSPWHCIASIVCALRGSSLCPHSTLLHVRQEYSCTQYNAVFCTLYSVRRIMYLAVPESAFLWPRPTELHKQHAVRQGPLPISSYKNKRTLHFPNDEKAGCMDQGWQRTGTNARPAYLFLHRLVFGVSYFYVFIHFSFFYHAFLFTCTLYISQHFDRSPGEASSCISNESTAAKCVSESAPHGMFLFLAPVVGLLP